MQEDSQGMSYFLIALYLLFAIGYFLIAFSYKNKSRKIDAGADIPKQDRHYWEQITKKCMKGFFVAAAGGLLTAIAIAIKSALPAEVGCITLLSANVFSLATICRKTPFRPCERSLALQKKCKIILLLLSFAALIMTQFVFQYFNDLIKLA